MPTPTTRPPADLLPSVVLDAFEEAHGFPLLDHLVCFTRGGSETQGTKLPDSPTADLDVHGVIVPPVHSLLGLRPWGGAKQHWEWKSDALDVVIVSAWKECALLEESNPDALQRLFLRDEDVLYLHPAWAPVFGARTQFLTRAAWPRLRGYATRMLERMVPFTAEDRAAWEAALAVLERAGWSLDAVLQHHALAMPRDRALTPEDGAHAIAEVRRMHARFFQGTMGAKRKQHILTHGYDAKMCAHVVRLLAMGLELLRDGTFQVWRTDDAEHLMAIKRGQFPLAEVRAEAERLLAAADAAIETSPLPAKTPPGLASDLLTAVQLPFCVAAASRNQG